MSELTAILTHRRRLVALLAAASVAVLAPAAPALAAAPAPAWAISATAMPTHFAPGDASDNISLVVRNDGGAASNGGTVTVTDTLPPDLTATAVSGEELFNGGFLTCTTAPVSCTYSGSLAPDDVLQIDVTVNVATAGPASATDSATVSGGGAASATTTADIPVTSAPASYGIVPGSLSLGITGPDGSPDLQAGAHPDVTVGWQFNTVATPNQEPLVPVGPVEPPKDAAVELPPGLLGNPQAVPKCARAEYFNGSCPVGSQVGIALLETGPSASGQGWFIEPVYNLVPEAGQTADFGLGAALAGTTPVQLVASVRTNGDYGVTETSSNITQSIPITGLSVTLWGDPADPSHDAARFLPQQGAPGNSGAPIPDPVPGSQFLINPTQCGGPLSVALHTDSWSNPGSFTSASSTLASGITGCEALQFDPSLSMQPDSTAAYAPSGYTVDLNVPQTSAPTQLSTPALQDATVTLPQGVVVSPPEADGLGACPLADDGVGTTAPPSCDTVAPNSKIGTVEISTPLLPDRLEGSVYLLQSNPPDLKILLAASADGVNVKLVGDARLNASTGQITTTFANTPPLPFSSLVLHLNDGPRSPLANPRTCGANTTTSDLTPWSSPVTPDATPSSTFTTTGCSSPTTFSPYFAAGTINPQAGAFSPFVVTFGRADGDQFFSGLTAQLPDGMLAKLAGVAECSDAQLAAAAAHSGEAELASPSCPASSQVGTVTTGSGPGSQPLFVGGKAYLTGAYKGAPYGLAVIVPAVVGPFDLGTVVIRQALYINPETARVTAVSDPFPTILDGVPLQIRRVDVDLNRPDFMVNPTSCNPMAVTGTLSSTLGVSAPVSSRFQVGGCAALGFSPRLRMQLAGKGRTRSGAHPRLVATLTQRRGQANIRSVRVALPLSLALDPNNSQHVCNYQVAQAVTTGPAKCPTSTLVGHATAVTPLLSQPLTGPVYLVQGIRYSHGRQIHTLPSLLVPLRGQIALNLRAKTSVSGGRLVSTFASIPDAAVSKFTLTINGGRKGILVITGRGRTICGKPQVTNARLGAQSGKQHDQRVRMATPCRKR